MLKTAHKKTKRLTAMLLACLLAHATIAAEPPTIVLIIDDMGNSLKLGNQALELPGPINYAFLPFTPNANTLAEQAHQLGKEVLLHAPMSNLLGKPLGPGGLRNGMGHQQFNYTLGRAINAIPHVKGVNNHMGSLLTAQTQPMEWLMQTLKQRQLYFIDSRTSPHSVALEQASKHQLPHLRRDIFLDNQRSQAAIHRQFEKLLQLAKERGIGVAIGHPYPETLAFLRKQLPTLKLRGYRLAHASSVLMPGDGCNEHSPILDILNNNCNQSVQLAQLASAKTASN